MSEEKEGRDIGSSSRTFSGVFALSFNISLVKEARRNFGIRFGDFIGDSSKTPRFRLNLLLVFFINDLPGTCSSTEDEEEVNSLFRRKFLSRESTELSQVAESAGVVGTEKLTKFNFGIRVNFDEFLGKLELPFLKSGFNLDDKLELKILYNQFKSEIYF